MMEFIGILIVAINAFFWTNLDDFVMLGFFFSRKAYTAKNIVVGQFLGIVALTAASILVGQGLAFGIQSLGWNLAWLGLLGLVPVWFGIKALHGEEDGDPETPEKSSFRQVVFVAGLTISNGGDNLGTYIPLFATMSSASVCLTAAVFVIMTALWCYGACRITAESGGANVNPRLEKSIPFVLMGIGVYIVLKSGVIPLVFDLL